jgi:uncharacterized membrane protein YfcA
VTVTEGLALAAAGVAAGVISTVVGLASVVSYPALLAIGLPPLAANMTNTVSLLFTGVGAAVGSRPELAGQATRVRRLGTIAALGGGAGAALLLITPSQTFVRLAPVLIGAASLALLAPSRRDRARRRGAGPDRDEGSRGAGPDRDERSRDAGAAREGRSRDSGPGRDGRGRDAGPGHGERRPWLLAGVFGVAVYIGYFGAAGGIVMLGLLIAMVAEPLARVNAVKNMLGAMGNAVAAVAFAVFGHVDWAAVVPLAAGFLVGGWTGPALVRRIPGRVLRIGVAVCGLVVAVKLGISAYR